MTEAIGPPHQVKKSNTDLNKTDGIHRKITAESSYLDYAPAKTLHNGICNR